MSDDAQVVVSGPSRSVELRLPWSSTVGELYEQARSQLELPGSGDYEISCADGVTMMNKLERTLQELRDGRICPKREFTIRVSGQDRAE
ncbi:MAG TPA: hypothetical protein DCK96_02900 [Chloroflexi bacterium]|jgi:hypothetical protein|nr:hypothetical protein [Chloroflexota bacterium]